MKETHHYLGWVAKLERQIQPCTVEELLNGSHEELHQHRNILLHTTQHRRMDFYAALQKDGFRLPRDVRPCTLFSGHVNGFRRVYQRKIAEAKRNVLAPKQDAENLLAEYYTLIQLGYLLQDPVLQSTNHAKSAASRQSTLVESPKRTMFEWVNELSKACEQQVESAPTDEPTASNIAHARKIGTITRYLDAEVVLRDPKPSLFIAVAADIRLELLKPTLSKLMDMNPKEGSDQRRAWFETICAGFLKAGDMRVALEQMKKSSPDHLIHTDPISLLMAEEDPDSDY